MEDLSKKLYGHVERVTAQDVKADPHYWLQVNGIKANEYKRHGRTDEQIERNCLTGSFLETGMLMLCDRLGIPAKRKNNEKHHDDRDPTTHAADLLIDGLMVQAKATSKVGRILQPLLKDYQAEPLITGIRSKNVEVIIYGGIVIREDESDAVVIPSLLINALTIGRFMGYREKEKQYKFDLISSSSSPYSSWMLGNFNISEHYFKDNFKYDL